MYSQCPDCQTRFRVTAEMLRAARGTVRCGRCGSAFDALERLSDSIPPAGHGSAAGPTAASVTEPEVDAEYHFTAEDLERVFVEARDWREMAAAPGLPAAFESPDTGEATPVVVHEDSGVEDITLEGERIRIEAPTGEPAAELNPDGTDEFEILRHVPDSAHPDLEEQADREIEEFTRALEEAPAPPPEPMPEPIAEPLPLAAQRWRRPAEDEEPQAAAHRSAWPALAWSLGAFVLALVLAAQVMHHFRQDLVRHPQLGPPLRAAYERLGLDLMPNWDLAAFELRQWGNTADAAAQGRMVVRASLTNRAAFAQPHPILRLELEDRFGAVVATRDFEPSDYLKNPSQATRLIAPGSSSEAELLLADPGRDAVGYRLDICLRESATLLRCARGPG
jgi:predicted Zn finger-like uncharacterized protein